MLTKVDQKLEDGLRIRLNLVIGPGAHAELFRTLIRQPESHRVYGVLDLANSAASSIQDVADLWLGTGQVDGKADLASPPLKIRVDTLLRAGKSSALIRALADQPKNERSIRVVALAAFSVRMRAQRLRTSMQGPEDVTSDDSSSGTKRLPSLDQAVNSVSDERIRHAQNEALRLKKAQAVKAFFSASARGPNAVD